jgi:polyvinyl alcohol dehydrogenase (cytochrome)
LANPLRGGLLGGSQWGSAADNQRVYVAISDVVLHSIADAAAPGGSRIALDSKTGGGLHAIDLKSGRIVWSSRPATCPVTQAICSPAQSAAVAAIAGVVFSGALDGHLRAYSSADGSVMWDFDTAREFPTVNGKPARGGSIDATGAAVAGGLLFVNSGYNEFGGMPGNVLLAFSVDGKQPSRGQAVLTRTCPALIFQPPRMRHPYCRIAAMSIKCAESKGDDHSPAAPRHSRHCAFAP